MNTKYVVHAVTKLQGQKAALQDCAATIPHTKDALEACLLSFGLKDPTFGTGTLDDYLAC